MRSWTVGRLHRYVRVCTRKRLEVGGGFQASCWAAVKAVQSKWDVEVPSYIFGFELLRFWNLLLWRWNSGLSSLHTPRLLSFFRVLHRHHLLDYSIFTAGEPLPVILHIGICNLVTHRARQMLMSRASWVRNLPYLKEQLLHCSVTCHLGSQFRANVARYNFFKKSEMWFYIIFPDFKCLSEFLGNILQAEHVTGLYLAPRAAVYNFSSVALPCYFLPWTCHNLYLIYLLSIFVTEVYLVPNTVPGIVSSQ